MERTFEFDLFDRHHKFLYTPGVMFDAMDKYELDIEGILNLTGSNKADAIYFLANAMSKAAGSEETYDDKQYTPLETLYLETAVIRAMERGNHREYKPKQVSKTLEKIEKKKAGRALLARLFLWLLLRTLGYPLKKRTERQSE